jgi:YVTN family beta-propeller protein
MGSPRVNRSILTLLGLVVLSAPLFADAAPIALAREKEIVLDGGPFCDLLCFDAGSARLYVAHSPNVDVIDLAKGERVGVVEGVERAHGIVIVPDGKRGFATAGKSNKLVVFDPVTLKVTNQIDTGENPDVLLYVSSTKEVWSFNGKSKNVTCVDPTSLEVKATIVLEGKPELAVEQPDKGIVYVNYEDKSVVCAIDAKTHKVIDVHPLAPGEEPTGLALDAANGLLFAGCGNKKLVVISTADWKVVATLDIGEHCDGVVFDAATGNVFASCKAVTSVVHEKDAKTFEALTALDTPNGKTCALDPKSHRLYVSSSPRRGETGTVKVFVFGPPAAAPASK